MSAIVGPIRDLNLGPLVAEDIRARGVLSGVQSSVSVGEVRLTDVVLPFEVMGLTLSQIGIETIKAPRIEVK